MTCRQALCLAVICIALYFLTGCIGSRSTQTETGMISGVIAGQVVAVKWTRDTEGHVNVEIPPALISAAMSGTSTTPWGAIIAGGVSLIGAAYAGRTSGTAAGQTQRANEHKADADEAWARLLEAAGQPKSKPA
jgi:hypothetical protein